MNNQLVIHYKKNNMKSTSIINQMKKLIQNIKGKFSFIISDKKNVRNFIKKKRGGIKELRGTYCTDIRILELCTHL